MNEFTPQQRKVIETWTEQRDTLLREIGLYTTERDDLRKSLSEAGLSLADLHNSISEARGRLAELTALEERHKDSVSIEVAQLEARKSRLEGECLAQEASLKASKEEQQSVAESTTVLKVAHEVMKDQAAVVNSVVGQIIETSQLHTSDMKTIMAEIKSVADDVIEKGNANVAQTNIVLEKLPKYIFELQKPIPVRRMYAAPEGTVIEPDVPAVTEE